MSTVPSSFSRFVSEEDLNRVRDEFLSALADLEAEDLGEDDAEAEGDAEASGQCPYTGARNADAS
ncbi:hypothetical protein [Actinoplanes sp. NPDC049265]|uniref:hypothetical protein n=1 Tax=Actinoplanes sp. NPDC049265 TaxID=3363902 RepID=UPI00371A6CA9